MALPTAASAATATFQGEALTAPPLGAGQVVTYPANSNVSGAVGNSAMAMWSTSTITATTTLAVSSVKVRVKATGVGAPAYFTLTVDGVYVGGPGPVTTGGWQDLTVEMPAQTRTSDTGSHTVALTFTGDAPNGDDRNLYVDQLIVDDTRPKLAWSPPSYTQTINVPATGATAPPPGTPNPWTVSTSANGLGGTYNLNNNVDYKIVLPTNASRRTLRLHGGHNITIIGGKIETSGGVALWIDGQATVGGVAPIVHVEGVEVDNINQSTYSDGIFLDSATAIYQIESTRVLNVQGREFDGQHGDVLQTPRGGSLRVDRFSATSYNQGMFIRPDTGSIGSIDIRHADISMMLQTCGDSDGNGKDDCSGGGDAIYFDNRADQATSTNGNQRTADAVTFSDTYVRSTRSSPDLVHPWSDDPDPFTVVPTPPAFDPDSYWRADVQGTATSGTISYPGTWNLPSYPVGKVTGFLTRGAPYFTYVKANEAGLNYSTPGYQ